MSSRRLPLATYTAKRRQRSISNPHTRPVPSSSPLKPVAHDADLTIEEMSRRMMKRSRSGLKRAHSGPDAHKSASEGASPVERVEDSRPAKRSKASARVPLATKSTQALLLERDGSVDMELTDVTGGMLTPAPHADSTAKQKQNDTFMNEKSDFLSPLPSSRSSKRVIAHRSSSKNLKENAIAKKVPNNNSNMLMTPASSDLGSPFSSRPGSPNVARSLAKKSFNKKLNRTRSVGTDLRRRATTRSFSRAVSPTSNASSPGIRRPSLPSAHNNGQNENQNWVVPVKFKQSYDQVVPRRPSETGVSFVRESSFFTGIPEACSTPVAPKRTSVMIPPTPGRDVDATPRMPLVKRSSALFSNNEDQDFSMMDEPTPRANTNKTTSALTRTEDSIFPDTIPEHDEEDLMPAISKPSSPQNQNARRRMTVHMSRDSIFSSAMDFSTSVMAGNPVSVAPQITDRTRVQLESVTLAPPSSPAVGQISPSSSDGDELRDMFSILGLDEDDQWFVNSVTEADDGTSASTNSRKKKSTISSRRSDLKQDTIGAKGRAMRAGASSSRASSSQKRVLIMADSPPPRPAAKKTASKQQNKGWPRPTIKMRILDKAIQPASDSSDELNLLKKRVTRGDDSTA